MKLMKILILTSVALLFTGCYTQLQYTQKMRKITDREEVRHSQQAEPQNNQRIDDRNYNDSYAEGEEVPVYYKDYAYANGWDCDCYPYNVYNFYGYNYYDPYLTLNSSYYYRWHPYRYYGYHHPYLGSRFSFSISFGWGNPYYYDPFYYDPFFYDYYWYGHSAFAFNYYRYYHNNGYYHGGGYYNHGGKTSNGTVRYAPRSIGANRVGTSVNTRSRDANVTTTTRSAVNNNGTTVRPRSTGVTRTSATTSGRTSSSATVTRSRSQSQSNQGRATTRTTRTRSRGAVQQHNNRQGPNSNSRSRGNLNNQNDHFRSEVIRSRTRVSKNSLQNLPSRAEIQQKLNSQRVRVSRPDVLQRRSRSTFFSRFKKFLNNSISNGSSIYNNHINIRSRSSSVSRSTHSSGHTSSSSTVTRSRSGSSGHSRSTGSSSRSRGGSSSTRSRGHHH